MHDDYTGLMLERVLDEIKAVHELVAEVPKMARKLDHVEQDVAELKQDMKVVRAATTDTSHQVHDLERRVSRLEAA
jgi:polyhydroxyalkanoate synthesis regulator phasin